MVNISKLMIGDWVETNPSYGKLACGIKSSIARVSEIGFSNSDGMYVSFDGIKGRYYDDEIEPIPLTTEILEKNGFELDDSNDKEYFNEYFGVDDRVMLRDNPEYMNTNNTWDVHIDTPDYRTIGNLELSYVHEFQHFLKSCKINKKIIL